MIRLNIPPSEDQRASKISPRSKSSYSPRTRQAFEQARKKLETLSNTKLLNDLGRLNHKERRLNVLVLLYLSEIDTRELYLLMGYSSLFDFCTVHLKYTRATAARRIRSARTVARYPEALDLLLSGEINITTLAMVSDVLDRDNHEVLLDSIRNKSTRHVEMLVSRRRPVPVIRDTVRPVCVMRRVESAPKAEGAETGGQDPTSTEDTGSRKCNKTSLSAETKLGDSGAAADGGRRAATGDSSPSAGTGSGAGRLPGRAVLEQRLKLGFTVTPEFMKKYNKIKALLSNKHPDGIDFETLFEHLMNEYLEKHDPEKKHARRIERAKSRKQTAGKEHCKKDTRSRRIPPAVRDRVYARDKGRCSFIGANGKRCNSSWDLEIDHEVPFARGGDNSPGNLRLLCRKHNSYQAERVYGREFMKNHIKK